MVWVIVLLIVIAAVMVKVSRSRKWSTLLSASGKGTEELSAKYAHLKAEGVQCRLKTEVSPSMGAVQGTEVDSATLLIHEKDVERAKLLLEQYEKDNEILKL